MSKYKLGKWVVDSSRGHLLSDDIIVHMEPKCMDLLLLLILANGELVSRKEIMESLWQGRYVSEHALNNVVAMLRKHLNSGSNNNYITTQPKRGYILSEPAVALETEVIEKTQAIEHSHVSEKQERKSRITMVLALVATVFITIALVIFKPEDINDTSIVILPFDAIDSEEDTEMFARGLVEEINHHLSSSDRLNVIVPTFEILTNEKRVSNQALASRLKAKFYLEGAVRAERNLLRITTRLVDGQSSRQLWSNVYTASKEDILSSQNDVSYQLTNAVINRIEMIHFTKGTERQVAANGQLNSDRDDSEVIEKASDFFHHLAAQADPTQSIINEWQIGMYNGSVFELFTYSATTLLNRAAIVGWVNKGFHAAFLNISDEDEMFPGNVFEAGALMLHPGQSGADIVLRYLVQQDGDYDISGHFFAVDGIECLKCTSDGVNVSVRVNGKQLNDSQNLLGFGSTRTHEITSSRVALQRGDIIDFIVMPRSTFFDDATALAASVSLSK